MFYLISKQEAISLGFKYYLTGSACRHGHTYFRMVSNNNCLKCARINALKRSRTPSVKAINKKNKQKAEYKEKQRDYVKSKRKTDKDIIKQDFKVDLDPSSAEYKREYAKRYYHANKARIKELYEKRPKEKRRDYINKWTRNYNKTPKGVAKVFMAKCIHRCLKNKRDTTESILGYMKEDLVVHLERQFLKGMNWDNRKEWHIDHIIPIVSFLEQGIEDPKVINALSNLKPIWAKDNLKKGREVKTLL